MNENLYFYFCNSISYFNTMRFQPFYNFFMGVAFSWTESDYGCNVGFKGGLVATVKEALYVLCSQLFLTVVTLNTFIF